MATKQYRIRRAREALHTATQEIDDAVNLDLAEYGDRILDSITRDAVRILMIVHEGDLKEIQDAIKAYCQ